MWEPKREHSPLNEIEANTEVGGFRRQSWSGGEQTAETDKPCGCGLPAPLSRGHKMETGTREKLQLQNSTLKKESY